MECMKFPYILLGQQLTVQDCFATFESRWKIHTEYGQKGHIEDGSTTLFTATLLQSASVLVQGQVGKGELLWGDEKGASCDSSVSGLLSCTHFSTVQFVSGYMNTFQCLFSFGNLYHPEWDDPKCSLTFNRKVSVKRVPDLTAGHLWTALCHRNSQLLVCIDMCVCVCEPRWYDPNRC